MATNLLPDPATAFGRRVRERLRTEYVIWLTTVGPDGTPQPNPVWFWWGDGEVLVYNRPAARRLTNVVDQPRVSLHFNGTDRGGDIVVLTGTARRDDQALPAHEVPGYAEKYRSGMARISGSPAAFGADYSAALRIRVTRIRGF